MFTALKMEDQVICNKTGSAKQDNYFRFYENIQKEKKTAYLRCFFLWQNILVDTEIIMLFCRTCFVANYFNPFFFFFQANKTKQNKKKKKCWACIANVFTALNNVEISSGCIL